MMFVQDDFFYYLKIAQNFAHGKGSTFNGLVTTNGYHPLWFAIIAIFSIFTCSPSAILALVSSSAFIASVVTYRCSRRLFDGSEVEQLLSIVMASMVTLYSLRLFFYGMEVTLVIPLMLCVICIFQKPDSILISWKQSLGFGVLISMMILARLDTILFAGLILVFALMERRWRGKVKGENLLGFVVGLIPLAIYLLINYHFFGVWLPVSGMAKQLKPNFWPSPRTWEGLYLTKPSFLAVFLPIPFGILLYPSVARRISPGNRIIYPAALFFPLVYFSILCCRSDWGIWPWYMYAQRPAVCVALVIFCTYPPLVRLLSTSIVTGILVVGLLAIMIGSQWRIQETSLYDQAVRIKQFSVTHPGIYAMGDRAGRVGYLLDQPVVQLEGLVMDKAYLDYLRRNTPLKETLDAYHVRYYISTYNEPDGACFLEDEPFQAGPQSPHMRGHFCNPVAVIISSGEMSLIFDLQAQNLRSHTARDAKVPNI